MGRKKVPRATWLLQTNGDHLDKESALELDTLFDAVAVNVYAASADRALKERLAGVDLTKSTARGITHAGRTSGFHFNNKYDDEDWVEHYDEVVVSPDALCTRVWTQAAIGHDGKVYICCRDNDKAHPVGDLSNSSLDDAYNSEVAREIRALMEHGRRDRISMCHTCEGKSKKPFVARASDLAPTTRARYARVREADGVLPNHRRAQPRGQLRRRHVRRRVQYLEDALWGL